MDFARSAEIRQIGKCQFAPDGLYRQIARSTRQIVARSPDRQIARSPDRQIAFDWPVLWHRRKMLHQCAEYAISDGFDQY